MLTLRISRGLSFAQKMTRNVLRCCSLRNLFVLNCLVLSLNIIFYVLNMHALPTYFWPIETYFMSPLDKTDKVLTDKLLRTFVETVEAANLTYFIYGGTLIGSLRHHNIIPWDDDVDVLMKASDKSRIVEILSKLDPDYGLHMTGSEYYASQWKLYPTNGRYVFHRQFRTPYIDIFFYRENDTHIWNASPEYSAQELWQKKHVFPLHRRPLGDLTVPAPCNALIVIGQHVNISMCRSRGFSHLVEVPLLSTPKSIPCEQLAHLYPFVHRSRLVNGSTNLVQETLMFGNFSIRHILAPSPC